MENTQLQVANHPKKAAQTLLLEQAGVTSTSKAMGSDPAFPPL